MSIAKRFWNKVEITPEWEQREVDDFLNKMEQHQDEIDKLKEGN